MRRNFSRLLLLSLVVAVGALVWVLMANYEMPSVTPVAKNPQRPLSITGMVYNTYSNEELTSRIKVESFVVRSRKFGVFRVRNVNEVALQTAQFDLYRNSSEADGQEKVAENSLTVGLSESIKGLSGLRGMGQLTRATIDSMLLNIHRDGSTFLQLKSRSAIFDFKKQLFNFERARLVGRQGKFQLITPRLIWDEQRNLFHVPGDYRLITAKGIQRGSGAVVDGELNLRPISIESSTVITSR